MTDFAKKLLNIPNSVYTKFLSKQSYYDIFKQNILTRFEDWDTTPYYKQVSLTKNIVYTVYKRPNTIILDIASYSRLSKYFEKTRGIRFEFSNYLGNITCQMFRRGYAPVNCIIRNDQNSIHNFIESLESLGLKLKRNDEITNINEFMTALVPDNMNPLTSDLLDQYEIDEFMES